MLEILKLFFKDQKTKGTIVPMKPLIIMRFVTVSGDSQKLITDVIYLFILGKSVG